MNFIVIGLGSMGKRRIRLLQEYIKRNEAESNWTILGVDTQESRRIECNKLYGITCFSSIIKALEVHSVDCALVCTSPLSHASIIEECLQNNLHVFTELNLVDDGYESNQALAKFNDKVLFLSSTFLYRKEVEYIKSKLGDNFTGIYQYHVGQYLPEWHPWENYKDFFVSNNRTNACREIFAIELPWLIDIMGEVSEIASFHTKASQLEVSYDDVYTVNLKHKNGAIGNIIVDIITPRAGRHFKAWNENIILDWDGTPDTLFFTDSKDGKTLPIQLYSEFKNLKNYNKFVIENAYYDEIENFIEVVSDKKQAKYSFSKDSTILKLIDEIEA